MKMRSIKEQLLSNSYEYLRTLPNFNNIKFELEKFERIMFVRADNGYLEIHVKFQRWQPCAGLYDGMFSFKETDIDHLKLYCEMNGLYIHGSGDDMYCVAWVLTI